MLKLVNQVFNEQLAFTQGNGDVVLTLRAVDDEDAPVDLTGASFSTQMVGPNGQGYALFGNAQHTALDQDTDRGAFNLTLDSDDTEMVGEGLNKVVLTSITIGGDTLTYRGIGILNVFADVPAQ